jgi:hypothetical protein
LPPLVRRHRQKGRRTLRAQGKDLIDLVAIPICRRRRIGAAMQKPPPSRAIDIRRTRAWEFLEGGRSIAPLRRRARCQNECCALIDRRKESRIFR